MWKNIIYIYHFFLCFFIPYPVLFATYFNTFKPALVYGFVFNNPVTNPKFYEKLCNYVKGLLFYKFECRFVT